MWMEDSTPLPRSYQNIDKSTVYLDIVTNLAPLRSYVLPYLHESIEISDMGIYFSCRKICFLFFFCIINIYSYIVFLSFIYFYKSFIYPHSLPPSLSLSILLILIPQSQSKWQWFLMIIWSGYN